MNVSKSNILDKVKQGLLCSVLAFLPSQVIADNRVQLASVAVPWTSGAVSGARPGVAPRPTSYSQFNPAVPIQVVPRRLSPEFNQECQPQDPRKLAKLQQQIATERKNLANAKIKKTNMAHQINRNNSAIKVGQAELQRLGKARVTFNDPQRINLRQMIKRLNKSNNHTKAMHRKFTNEEKNAKSRISELQRKIDNERGYCDT